MSDFLNFIRHHYHVIAECGLTLIVLFVTLFKKKVRIDDCFKSVLMVLPSLISLAETKYEIGSDKYSFVFNKCVEILMSLTHWSSDKVIEHYTADINSSIENILATPQKKER